MVCLTVSVMHFLGQELCHGQWAASPGERAHWDAHLTDRRGKLNGGNSERHTRNASDRLLGLPGVEQRPEFSERVLEGRGQQRRIRIEQRHRIARRIGTGGSTQTT